MGEEQFHAEIVDWCRNGGVATMMCLEVVGPLGRAGLSDKQGEVESLFTKRSSKEFRAAPERKNIDKGHGHPFRWKF